MKETPEIIELKRSALLEYLKLCSLINEVPRKEIFVLINSCNDEVTLRFSINESKESQKRFINFKSK